MPSSLSGTIYYMKYSVFHRYTQTQLGDIIHSMSIFIHSTVVMLSSFSETVHDTMYSVFYQYTYTTRRLHSFHVDLH